MTPEMDDRGNSDLMDLQIVDNLKRVYNHTLTEAVPDRFFDLLRKLREAEAGDVKPERDEVNESSEGLSSADDGPDDAGVTP